ncbi:glycosyltransferase [Candidatus Woesearchaeota archaeon]|nr:glycosyltransferase [Candidatus Woesearchaeota archaeon]
MNPLVSVIIPTYNREKLLAEAIESVIKQSYKNFEIIVVDDSSVDNTKKVVDRYKGRLRCYRTEKNSGNCGATARNIGIRNSKGEYIVIVDDDDQIDKDLIEKQIRFIKRYPSFKVVAANLTRIENKGKITDEIKNRFLREERRWQKLSNEEYYWDEFDNRGILMLHSGALVKKEVYEKAGLFDEDLKYWVDTDMILRTKLFYKIGLVLDSFYYWRIHDKNYSARDKGRVSAKVDRIYINKKIKRIIKKNRLKRYEKAINGRLASDYMAKGYWLRKDNKMKAFVCYLKSLYYCYNAKQLKAIGKLLIPGYYR